MILEQVIANEQADKANNRSQSEAVEAADIRAYNGRAVSTEPLSSFEAIICGRCATVCDADDNFCRQCGMALSDERLPSVRNGANVPAVWQPRIRGVALKSAVFIAAGTVVEMLVRRMVRRALAPLAGKRGPTRGRTEMVSSDEGEGRVESETLLVRHIRIRR
jgi:hypothetical protein